MQIQIPINPKTVHVLRGIGLFVLYAWVFWRAFKDNRGNRVIQCGSITLMLFLVMVALMKIPHFPIDYVAWLGPALFLLCMLTMFFLFQQAYRALRNAFHRRKTQ
jgi:heme A synthase